MIKRDNDGHRYDIPEDQEARFDEIMVFINDAEFGSDEWYNMNDLLDCVFGEYMVG